MLKYQKVIKVGNSLAVTLDKDFVSKTGLVPGDQLAASYKSEAGIISMSAATQYEARQEKNFKVADRANREAYLASKITPEFQAWVKKSLDEDKVAMEALKDL